MEQNHELLVAKIQHCSTAEFFVRVLGVWNNPKSGKTFNIQGKICQE